MQSINAGASNNDGLVLLHGMGTGASAWQPQLEALSGSYYVVAPYLPGYGPNPGPFSMLTAREQVAALVRNGNLAPVHACGLSLGALVALELAREHPDIVRSLILSAGFASLPEEYLVPRQAAAESVRSMEAATIRETVLPGLVRGVPSAYQDTAMEEIGNLTQTDLVGLISFEFDACAWIRDIGIPTLVLCGENDEVNLPLSRELVDLLPNATFEVVPNAGHVANLDSPEEFTRVLEAFLGSVK